MTAAAVDWQSRARQLADRIAADGLLGDTAWRAAVEEIPRHVFVPRFHRQGPDGTWSQTTSADPGWLDAVYDDVPLVTALTTNEAGATAVVSSSTKPGLMLRMLAVLDIHDGDRMLEVGSGTGYNAALLAHRLGDAHVFSVDIDADLVDLARERLASLGYAPKLAATDGAAGLPGHAPYDHIIATCSVSAVPRAWADQLSEDGSVLVDLKRGAHAGNLVHLHRFDDRLEGRFLSRWAAFMTMRTDATPQETRAGVAAVDLDAGERSATELDPDPWATPVPWFLAASTLPRPTTLGYLGITDAGPEWVVHGDRAGSWCAIRMRPDQHGRREVREHGPVPIWQRFTDAYNQWDQLGRAGWERLGLTVLPDGHHRIWQDDPGALGWDLT